MTSTKVTNKWPSHLHHPQKWIIDLLLKIMESTNTWQILRIPLPTSLLCRHHKCMFPFCFFKVWSVTCLNTNETSNFMKIQWSYLLSSYQENQASLYFQLFLNIFLISLCQYPSYMFAIRDKILFLKYNWWKWKIKAEIQVNEEYINFLFSNFCFSQFLLHT